MFRFGKFFWDTVLLRPQTASNHTVPDLHPHEIANIINKFRSAKKQVTSSYKQIKKRKGSPTFCYEKVCNSMYRTELFRKFPHAQTRINCRAIIQQSRGT